MKNGFSLKAETVFGYGYEGNEFNRYMEVCINKNKYTKQYLYNTTTMLNIL